MSFFIVKNNIWIRNYQIIQKSEKGEGDTNLIEIGPRMVLIPIRIFNGSLGGATLYQNPSFVSPNEERSVFKKRKGDRYTERIEHKKEHSEYVKKIQPPIDPLVGLNVFKR
jgi:ribosome biogenesis protein BRX1